MEKKTFILTKNDSGRRLDRIIRKFLTDVSLPKIYQAIRKGLIRINEKRVDISYKTVEGDVLTIASLMFSGSGAAERHDMPQKSPPQAKQKKHRASDIPVLLRTDDLLIINKPAGLPVHGPLSIASMLVETLTASAAGLSFTPGPLHRLDKNTTGILCFSRTLTGAQWFSQCLHDNTVDKYYLGVVRGALSAQRLESGEPAKPAITYCHPLSYNGNINASLMLFRLVTGKKHQIRLHVKESGHPLAGDAQYGGGSPLSCCNRYILHAWRLYFPADRLIGLPPYIEAPLFADTAACLTRFFSGWEKTALHILSTRSF